MKHNSEKWVCFADHSAVRNYEGVSLILCRTWGPCALVFTFLLLITVDLRAQSRSQQVADLTSEGASQLILDIYKSRVNTTLWHCIVKVDGFSLIDGKEVKYYEAWEVWVDGVKAKAAPWAPPKDAPPWKVRFADPAQLCIGCVGDTLAYYPKQALPAGELKAALSIYDPITAFDALRMVDPRRIGLVPYAVGTELGMNLPLYYDLQTANPSVKANREDNEVAVTIDRPNFGLLTYTLAGAWDLYPVSINIRSSVDGNSEVSTATLEYERIENRIIPKRVTCERRIDGRVTNSEDCQIETISLGKPFPEDIFTLKSLGVPAGTSVNWAAAIAEPPGQPGTLIFDGEKIVGQPVSALGKRIAFESISDSPGDTKIRFILIVANCIVIACIAFFIARSMVRKKRESINV